MALSNDFSVIWTGRVSCWISHIRLVTSSKIWLSVAIQSLASTISKIGGGDGVGDGFSTHANTPMFLVSDTTLNIRWQVSTTEHIWLGLFPCGFVFTPINPP